MRYHLTLARNYVREPDKFVKTAVNLLRTPFVDTFVVSWPKAGRTWLRVMLGRVLILHAGLDEKQLLDTYALTRRTGGDRVLFSHAGRFHLPDTRPLDDMTFRTHPFARRKVVFLVRDVRDVLVSYFHQESKRTRVFRGDIHDFVRDEILGIRKIVAYTTLWYRNRHRPRAFLLMRYEDMHAEPQRQLRRALDFLGLDAVSDDTVREAVEYAAFENMRRLESGGQYRDSMLLSRSSGDVNTFKTRKGKVGGYVDELSADDLRYVEQALEEHRDPDCDWYLAADLDGKTAGAP